METWWTDALHTAQVAAAEAGQALRDMLYSASVREKKPRDLVTDADLAAQRIIEAHVRRDFPEHAFVGEEGPSNTNKSLTVDGATTASPWRWVVDPLDGTANYVHRLPNFAVSIALMHQDSVCIGVVYDPIAREMFSAMSGAGAFLNAQPISVSSRTELNSSLVAASFPPQVDRDSLEVRQFVEMLIRCQSVRRLGSAALNLCFVACGRLDAYWAGRLHAWDIAAGALIAAEAGAVVTGQVGERFDPWSGSLVAAATSTLHQELVQCLETVSKSEQST